MQLTAPTKARGERGFTLIELTIGAALMALILASAYACLSAGLSARRLLEPRLEAIQSARVAMGLITADLRAACPLAKEADFVGMSRTIGKAEADNLDFGTLNYTPSRQGEGDFCQTSYYLDQDRKTGELVLWRRRNPRIGLDPFSGGSREELARGLRQLKFEYYDGFDWFDTWGDPEGKGKQETSQKLQSNLTGLPDAVRITMAFASEAPRAKPDDSAGSTVAAAGSEEDDSTPLVFQTVVRVNVVSGAGSSTGSGTGGSGAPQNSGGPGSAPGAARPPPGGRG